MSQDTKNYINLVLSALAGGLVSACGVAATTHDKWTISVAGMMGLGTALIQHMRQLPRKEWSEEERSKNEAPR